GKSHVNSSIPDPLNKLVTDHFLQPQRYERKRFAKCANGAGYERMKRTHRCNSDADLTQLSARDTPRRFKGLVEVRQHGPHIVEERAPSVRQIDPTCFAMEQLHIELTFHRLDAEAERRLLHAKPLRGSRDMPFLRNGDEVSKVPQLHSHTQIGMNFAVAIL